MNLELEEYEEASKEKEQDFIGSASSTLELNFFEISIVLLHWSHASPAELMTAFRTLHTSTSTVFLYHDSTVRARRGHHEIT